MTPVRSEGVVQTCRERVRRQIRPIGPAAPFNLEAEEQTAGGAEVDHYVRGAEPDLIAARMHVVWAEVVVHPFDPDSFLDVLSQRKLESVAVEAAAEIVHFVLLENRERAADVELFGSEPCAENRGFVTALRLVDRWLEDAVPDL